MVEKLRAAGFVLFDVQLMTEHLRSMGAVEISRTEYLGRLAAAVKLSCGFIAGG
jgi:leucyl/phenylalanyl-tRNA--protein transferase